MVRDDAGNGLRGLRATPSTELFEALYQHYRINVGDGAVDLGGSSSLNLLVTDAPPRYVARVYRPYVTEARLKAIHNVQRALTANGIPCSEIVPTQAGQSWIRLADRLVEVEHYVDHDGKMDSWERLKTGLPILGKIHSILHTVALDDDGKKPLFANHIDPLETLPRTLKGIQRIRTWNHPSVEDRQLADAAEELVYVVSRAEQQLVKQLPTQIAHGDFWDNNVLFRAEQVIHVADFDFMGERARMDDLALTLYFALISWESPVAGLTNDLLGRLHELVNAYNSGLDDPLTPVERAALPLAIARQPLWSIGGWIALLDEEESARRHAAGMGGEIEAALRIIRDIDQWREAFA